MYEIRRCLVEGDHLDRATKASVQGVLELSDGARHARIRAVPKEHTQIDIASFPSGSPRMAAEEVNGRDPRRRRRRIAVARSQFDRSCRYDI